MPAVLDLSRLARPDGPWLHHLVAPLSETFDAICALEARAGVVARIVRGRHATTRSALFNEFSAALQFPPHFGANWDAFHDCLSDLTWLHTSTVVVCVTESLRLLDTANEDQLGSFVTALRSALTNVAEGPHLMGRPRALHVVFHAVPEDGPACRAHWESSGLTIHPLA